MEAKGEKMYLFKSEKGFSLIEITIVIVLIGILAITVRARFSSLAESVKITTCKVNQLSLQSAQLLYFTNSALLNNNEGQYADNINDLTPYLKKNTIPECPDNGSYVLLENGLVTCTQPTHQRSD